MTKPRGICVPHQHVPLDFSKLEEACGLQFSTELRQRVQEAVESYRAWTSPEAKAPPLGDVRTRLKRIEKACQALVPMLQAFALGAVSPEAEAMRLSYPSSEYHIWQDPGKLAVLLGEIASNAHSLAQEEGKRGHPGTQEQSHLITAVHQVYRAAGGIGRGCHADGASGSGYAGPFYRLMIETIHQVEKGVMNPAGIGKNICESIVLPPQGN